VRRTDGQTDMKKLIVDLRNFSKAHKMNNTGIRIKECHRQDSEPVISISGPYNLS
jgi:hypothetical protein